MKKRYLLFVITLLLGFQGISSHFAGGNIYYECIGGNQYRVWAELTLDCLGAGSPSSFRVSVGNDCGFADTSINLQLVPSLTTMVSQVCAKDIVLTTCFGGGSLPGRNKYVYSAVITLQACSTWTFGSSSCCRNGAVVNLSTAANLYLETTLNNVIDTCNTSVKFYGIVNPYVCVNSTSSYNFEGFDSDGDSLVYSLVSAMSDSAVVIPYILPFSPLNPISGINLDQNTGIITFTPTSLGVYVVVVNVKEYDSAGNLKGSTLRDIQVIVYNCGANKSPDVNNTSLTNLIGDGQIVAPKKIIACVGDSFSVDIQISDLNVLDSLKITASNLSTTMPGAILTFSGHNPIVATLSWKVPPSARRINRANFLVIDDYCPVSGVNSFGITVEVVMRTKIFSDMTICLGDSANLFTAGGSSVNWSSLSGSMLAVGVNFSCDTCLNVMAKPTVTTVYELNNTTVGSGCAGRDTVTVIVAPNFNYTVNYSPTSICLNDSVQFNVQPVQIDTYTYKWSPSLFFNNDSVSNPILTPTNSTVNSYSVIITNSQGCSKDYTIGTSLVTPLRINKTDTFCGNYTQVPGKIYTSSGVYSDTLYSITGCDSVYQTLSLVKDTINLTYSIFSNFNLYAINDTGRTYQWIDCFTNSIVAGADSSYFRASSSGTYACVISYRNCIDTTECLTVAFSNLNKQIFSKIIKVYPNPSSEEVVFNFGEVLKEATIEFVDISGKVVKAEKIVNASSHKSTISLLSKGVYIIRLKENNEFKYMKFIKN